MSESVDPRPGIESLTRNFTSFYSGRHLYQQQKNFIVILHAGYVSLNLSEFSVGICEDDRGEATDNRKYSSEFL